MTRPPRPESGSELKLALEFERTGEPHLLLRTRGDGPLDGVQLTAAQPRLTIGRSEECDLALPWDPAASRLHAELVRTAADWVVVDDGLSTNGTFVNGERVSGRRRLRDGDVIVAGGSALAFRDPAAAGTGATAPAGRRVAPAELSPMQQRVLQALCRPLAAGSGDRALPASNQEIADELVLTTDTVKAHLRALYRAFELEALPQNEKRARLASLALAAGLVPARDLGVTG